MTHQGNLEMLRLYLSAGLSHDVREKHAPDMALPVVRAIRARADPRRHGAPDADHLNAQVVAPVGRGRAGRLT